MRVDRNHGWDAPCFENVVDFRNGVNERYSSTAARDRDGLFSEMLDPVTLRHRLSPALPLKVNRDFDQEVAREVG